MWLSIWLALALAPVPDGAPFSLAADIVPGSALDARYLLDPPAGRHGGVRLAGDHLVYADGSAARFYGVNLCWEALYPTPEQAAEVAQRLAMSGVNLVRLTYLDSFAPRGLFDPNAPDTATIDPAQLDRLDRFIAELKQRGIYGLVCLSMGQGLVRAADGFPEITAMSEREAMEEVGRFIEPRMRELDRRRFTALLAHRNPYTGLRWAEEPAFIGFELLNERSIFYVYAQLAHLPAATLELLRQRFNQWLAARYGDDATLRRHWPDQLADDESLSAGTIRLDLELSQLARWRKEQPAPREGRAADWSRFLAELNLAYVRAASGWLSELGVAAPISASGGGAFVQADHWLNRQQGVFYQHSYFDHPSWPADSPMRYTNRSALQSGLPLTRSFAAQRHAGQPYGISEYDYCFPNDWRAEGGAALTAYGTFQGWDVMLRFAYWANPWANREQWYRGGDRGIASVWRIQNDPAAFGPWPAWAAMFLRRDLAPARHAVELGYSDADTFYRERYRWPPAYLDFLSTAALQHRLGARHFEQSYEGDADLVIASGRTASGDYRAARRVLAASANPFGDVYGLAAPGFQVGRTGLAVTGPAGALDADSLRRMVQERYGPELLPPAEAGWIVADTGQLRYHQERGVLLIDSPRTRGFVGFGGGEWELSGLRLNVATDFAMILFTSLTDTPLETSPRILITAVGRCQNADFERRPIAQGFEATGASLGREPTVIQPIEFGFELSGGGTVHALDAAGNRLREVDRSAVGRPGQPVTIYYELSRSPVG